MKTGGVMMQWAVLWIAVSLNTMAFGGEINQASRGPEKIIESIEQVRITTTDRSKAESTSGKCGLTLWFDVQREWNNFSAAQKNRIQILLSEPSRQKSRIIGRFQFYYDTTGSYQPALIDSLYQRIPNTAEQYVDSSGKIFNEVWEYEVDSLGYSEPPVNPDGTYHVVISGLPFGYYGITWPDSIQFDYSPSFRYSTYIEIDNDFSNVYTPTRGMPALKVTAAHEFHHAIQLGSYGSWDEDRYFYEVTSTWMEDVVYDDVNDYYQYLTNSITRNSQFSHPEVRFTEYNAEIEYSRAVWGKFIEERFSRDLMKRIWEFMGASGSIQAMNSALTESGSSLKSAFLEFSYWNYFTGSNADTLLYYSEGNRYPDIRLLPERTYFSPGISIVDSIQSLSSLYQPILVNGNKMLSIISNVNTASAYSFDTHPFMYALTGAPAAGSRHLANGLYASMNVGDPQNWSSQETVPAVVNEILVYPNPFHPAGNMPMMFRLPQANQTVAVLSIFSSSMLRVFSGELAVQTPRPFEPALAWNAHDDQNNAIASGIYFYLIQIDGVEYLGKFSVIRD